MNKFDITQKMIASEDFDITKVIIAVYYKHTDLTRKTRRRIMKPVKKFRKLLRQCSKALDRGERYETALLMKKVPKARKRVKKVFTEQAGIDAEAVYTKLTKMRNKLERRQERGNG